MANGDPIIQGVVNQEQSSTNLFNSATAGDGTVLYLFASPQAGGYGLYSVGYGPGPGVTGYSYGADGVRGVAVPPSGRVGVSGTGTNTSPGVQGTSTGSRGVEGSSTDGIGVWGHSNNAVGISGTTPSGRIGVFGSASTSGVGVYGETLPPSPFNRPLFYPPDAGVVGHSEGGIGVYGHSDQGWAARFEGGQGVFINGSLAVTGVKSAVVQHSDGSHRRLYCIESPQSWFEDFGEARLEAGQARVTLDPDFAALVDTASYQVFLTSYGPVQLYVVDRQADFFEVRAMPGAGDVTEENRNTVSMAFGYRVVAPRSDVPGRFERMGVPEPVAAEPLSPSDWERLRPSEPLDPAAVAAAVAEETRRHRLPD